MKTVKLILTRLKKPHVLLGVLSQMIIILKVFDVKINTESLSVIVTAICSILVLMGIIADPDNSNYGLCNEIQKCENCGQTTCHLKVDDTLICKNCGHQIKITKEQEDTKIQIETDSVTQ